MRLTGSCPRNKERTLFVFFQRPPNRPRFPRNNRSLQFQGDFCLFPSHPPSEADRGVTYLKLAAATRRRWLVLDEFAKYAFFGLTRKNPAFERSVLMYVSIKNRILTQSDPKRRVCVNAADRLLPPKQRANSLCIFPTPSKPTTLPQKQPFPAIPGRFLPFPKPPAIRSRSWSHLP